MCYLHYCDKPCNECAIRLFLRRVFPPEDTGLQAPAVIVYRPVVLEHMFHPWEKPRAFDSPRELRAETERRGVTSEYLRDSSLWRHRDPAW
jgi:hypothetical protein